MHIMRIITNKKKHILRETIYILTIMGIINNVKRLILKSTLNKKRKKKLVRMIYI